MYDKNDGRVNELYLFHGSRKVTAETICGSEEGFDMHYSCEGMWGGAIILQTKQGTWSSMPIMTVLNVVMR